MTYRPSRRDFLRTGGAAVLLASAQGLSPACAPAARRVASAAAPSFRNWSGCQRAQPSALLYPADEAELARAVTASRGPIRCVGGAHSFSPLVPSPGTLISLEALTGLLSHDAERCTATLHAGTRLMMAGDLLAGVGQSLHNQPDIDLQSLAGAISTATHGTGLSLQCLSAYATGLRLVLADASVVECSAQQDAELFHAARVGLGSCGVISAVTLQNRAAYRLAEHAYALDLDAALALVDARKGVDRHIEIFAFPFGKTALVKQTNIVGSAQTRAPADSAFDQNALLKLGADAVRALPWTNSTLQRLAGAFIEDSWHIDTAHRVFPTARSVPFNEMEYSVPAERGIECLQEVMHAMRELDLPVFFPIEFRYTAADELWLSPFYERASASISLHQYASQDYAPYFDAIEPIFHKYGGRPHWGKLHSLRAPQLRELYPRWDAFCAVRKRVDPSGRFLNAHVRAVLGVAS